MRAAFRRYGVLCLLLLAPLAACMSGNIARLATPNAIIDNGPIGNGQILSSTVASADTASWSFNETTGSHVIIANVSTPDAESAFIPDMAVNYPDGTEIKATGAWPAGRIVLNSSNFTQSGAYTLTVKPQNNTGMTGHFTLNLILANFPYTVQPGGGGTMYSGVTYNGTATLTNLYQWTYAAKAGDPLSFSMTNTTGISGIVYVMNPDGTEAKSGSGASPHVTFTAGQTGNYMVVVGNLSYTTASNSYTLTATGSSLLPETAKADGAICLPCLQKAQLAAASYPVNAVGQVAAGDPVSMATGNLYEGVTDYTTVGTNPLALTRSYNSLSYTRNLYLTLMGPNWRTNYDRYLQVVSGTQAVAQRADGQAINFTLVSSVWTPDTDVDVKLTNAGATYTLTDSDDTVEVYTVASGKGTLNSITKPNGYVQTLNYTAGVLTSVSDSYSRSLGFTYTGGVLTGVTTPDAATLTYGYTATAGQQLLTSVAYNTSPATSQTYLYENTALPFALTGITDENGNRYATWAYDGAGRAVSSKLGDTLGANFTQIAYDDATGNRTVTGPLGETLTYKFTTLQGLSKVSEIDRAAAAPVLAATRNFTYDANGYLATATDWNGNATHWTNNSHGLPTSVTEAFGSTVARTTGIVYDTTWVHKPYTVTKTNLTVDDRYDATQGTLLTHTLTDTTGGSTNGQTHIWTYTYNGTGEMLTATAPRTDVTVKTVYTYTAGALASVTDPVGNLTTINTANGTGQPTKITDPNSVETDLAYDNRNRLTMKTVKATPSNEVTQISYTGSGQPHVITLPDSSTVTFGYDNAQRLTSIANTAGETVNYTLNAAGGATTSAVKDSGGTVRQSSTATYDVLNDRLTRVGSAGVAQTTSYAWDGNRNRLSVTDADSNETQTAWDALNRASTVTDALTHTAAPTYNNLDQVTAQTDFNGYSTGFTHDAFGNVIAKSSPDTGSSSYIYDEDNNQTKRTDARSVVTNRTFDKNDRPLTETFPAGTAENIAYGYDSTAGGNKGVGHLTSFSDESGSTTQKFDNFGNLVQTVRTIGAHNYTTSYSYDLANRVTQIIYPSGRYVNYTYDTSGYLTTVTTKPTAGGTVTTLASSIVHKPFGPVASFTYGNTLGQTRTYDNNYWLDDLVTANGATHIQDLTYGFDNAGNLTGITDNLDATRNQTFGPDALNRLHTATGPYGSRTYTYDNNSNRATWYNGTSTRTSAYTTGTNLLATITSGASVRHFTNSASGNMLTDDRVFNGAVPITNTYGGRDRLESSATSTLTTSFAINALGQRVVKSNSSAATDYQYDQAGHVIGEANHSTGAKIRDYVWMDGLPLSQINGTSIFYLHPDQVDAPQKITDPTMTLVWDREQEPFGETYATPTNMTSTNLRFPGQYTDLENKLNYNGVRDYDPTLGRYVQSDPLGLWAAPNLFGYAGQNPLQNIDPLGLDTQYGISFSGSLALLLVGTTDSVTIGINVPNTRTTSQSGYQLFVSPQVTGMVGEGIFAGYGFGYAHSVTDGPLPALLSGQWGYYGEGDVGFGPSLSGSGQLSRTNECTKNDDQGLGTFGYSVGVPTPRIGEGYGLWLGGGVNGSATLATPTGAQLQNFLNSLPW